MFDLKIIKERYSTLYDEELIHLARTDGSELTKDALLILREELQLRGIDPAIISTHKEIQPASEQEMEQELMTHQNFDLAGSGITYQEMMYDSIPEEKSTEAAQELPSAEEIKRGLEKARSAMRVHGFIFLAGLVVTIGSVIAAENGGSFVLAWGAILFGGIKFLEALGTWHKLRSTRSGMSVISGEKENEGATKEQ